MTFSNYLTEVRIRKAQGADGADRFENYEISQSVGYNSVEHFTRVFEKDLPGQPGRLPKIKT